MGFPSSYDGFLHFEEGLLESIQQLAI